MPPPIGIPSRHRSLTLLAAVVIVQVLLLAAQIKRERQVRLIRVWAVELISLVPPTGRTERSCRTRSNFTCIASVISLISSRKMVPPPATSNVSKR